MAMSAVQLNAFRMELEKISAVSARAGKSSGGVSTLELKPSPRGLGIHDKRTGEKNRALAYTSGVAGAAVGASAISAAHRGLSGMSIPKGVSELYKGRPESYLKGFDKVVDRTKLKKALPAALINKKLGLLSALNIKKVLRRGAVGAVGGAALGAGLRALHNIGSYETSKALAGKSGHKKTSAKRTPQSQKPACGKCGRKDWIDMRGRLCDRCAFPKKKTAMARKPMTKSQLGQFLKNTAVIGGSAALGGGAAWATRRALIGKLSKLPAGKKKDVLKILPYALGLGTAAGGALMTSRNKTRDELIRKAGLKKDFRIKKQPNA
jgi:hypothetical protein